MERCQLREGPFQVLQVSDLVSLLDRFTNY